MQASQQVKRLAFNASGMVPGARKIAEETPVAISYDGTTHAVMMASPDDIVDFAIGFSLTEGIIAERAEIADLTIVSHGGGIEAQIQLAGDASRELKARRRQMAGPVGCGLCGIDSIEQALKPA